MKISEAIKWIDNRMCFGRGQWSEHHQPIIDEVWQAGRMAIEALQNSQWIPVTECLPKERKPVLLSQSFGLMCVGCLIGKAEDGTAIWMDLSSQLCETHGKTFAWMPLPKPYREEDKG